jgi:cytochrome c
MEIQKFAIKLSGLMLLASVQFAGHAMAMDAGAAEGLAKRSMCLTCHAVDQKKVGPSYHDVAVKYKGVAGADEKIIHHMTSGPMIKMPNGQMAKHLVIKTTDQDQLKNLAEWILSR